MINFLARDSNSRGRNFTHPNACVNSFTLFLSVENRAFEFLLEYFAPLSRHTLGEGFSCFLQACFVTTFWQHFSENTVISVISVNTRNSRKPLEIKEKPPFLAAFNPWRCGESNPGPMTEPSVFYVRSLLTVRRFFCPHRCRRQLMASISTVKVPCRPCGSAGKASLLNDAQHPPKDEGE